MDVISSNAPYIINVATRDGDGNPLGQYRIYKGDSSAGELIYTGQLYSEEGGHAAAEPVNIQPILVNYTSNDVGKLTNYGNDFTTGGTGYLNTKFAVEYQRTTGDSSTLVLNMLYCTENATNQELGFDSSTNTFPMLANDFIQGKFVNGTYLPITQLFANNTTSTSTFGIIGLTSAGAGTSVHSSSPYQQSKRYGGTFTFSSTYANFYITRGGSRISKNIEILNCVPENTFILYYVNSLGAVDYIICDKKNSVTYNADRHSITKYATIQDRTAFGKLNYLNNTTRTWTLNTDIMDDEQSKQMYKVFNSEYMWLYNCDKGEINAVILEDASLKIKRFDADKVYNYTITVKESQTFTIQ